MITLNDFQRIKKGKISPQFLRFSQIYHSFSICKNIVDENICFHFAEKERVVRAVFCF